MKHTQRMVSLVLGAVMGIAASGSIAHGEYLQNFESLADGSISGQDSWSVLGGDPASGLIVTDGSVAFEGVKYLTMRQGGGSSARVLRLIGGPLNDNDNSIIQFALRFDTLSANALRVYFNANGGPLETIATRFDDQGAIFASTNGFNNETLSLGASLQTGLWYRVSYKLEPSTASYDFNVVRASDAQTILTTNLPFATPSPLATSANNIEFYVDGDATFNYKIDSLMIVPEPSAAMLLATSGLAWLFAMRRRRP